MSLVSIAELRARVKSGLTDTNLQAIIDNEEAELVRRYGAHGDGVSTVTEDAQPTGCELFLDRPIASITSVTEAQSLGGTGSALTSSNYYLYARQARLVRLPVGTPWGPQVTVVYAPVDDQARRKRIIIELCRLALEQTAMKSENVAGEYSFQAPEWEQARNQLYRRLQFTEV